MLLYALRRRPRQFLGLTLALAVPATALLAATGVPTVQLLIVMIVAPLYVLVGLWLSTRIVQYLLVAGRRNARRDIIHGEYLDPDPRGRIPGWMTMKIRVRYIIPLEVYVEAYNRCVMSSQVCPHGVRNPRAPLLRVA